MKDLVESFPQQLRDALQIGREAEMKPADSEIRHVVIAGMGGSGIGARYVSALVSDSCAAPISVISDYNIPAWVDHHTLGIASSYSGNTEETLAAFLKMREAGSKPVVVSSGGRLLDMAQSERIDHIALPSGWPAPRACLGLSLINLLYVLHYQDLIPPDFIGQTEKAIALLEEEQPDIKQRASQLAGFLDSQLPVLYTTPELEPVAVRFRQQLAENSKILAWHHVVPEMNHNEIVGWHQEYPRAGVIFLRHRQAHARNQIRMDFVKEITARYAASTIELQAKGDSLLEKMLYLTHFADWTSVYLADQHGVDVMSIKAIDYLKAILAKS